MFDSSKNWSEAPAICIVFDASNRVVSYRFFAAKDDEALGAIFQRWAQTDAPA